MREIVLDTETTGLDPLNGDRIVEIGGVELINLMPTGRIFHGYYNPERSVPMEAARVHGLTDDILADKPLFASEADAFLSFIEDSPLVIHNAPFDMGFVNAELRRLGFKILPMSRVVDTLVLARQLFPGAPNSLDALCKRYNVDASARENHGALLDARLLADVYLEMKGGRQPDLAIGVMANVAVRNFDNVSREHRPPRSHAPTDQESAAHQEFLKNLNNPLWKKRRRA